MLIAWGVWLLASERQRSAMSRVMLIGAIVVITAMALWIIFVLPAYMD